MTDGGSAIGLDVGGTKINAFRVARDGSVQERRSVATPAHDPEATIASMVEVSRDLLTDEVLAIGVGAAGLVDVAQGVLRFAPNLAWRNLPIAARMRDAIGLPCQLDNDANVAAWGEWRFGAGRGYRHMLLVTVGTGIGGGIVAGRRLFRGAHGFAAEIGHIIVEPDGPLCGCGNRGCWEQAASGQAIGRLGREAAREHPDSLLASLAGGDPEAVSGTTVGDAAREDDPMAIEILREVGRRLGEGIAGLINVLDPQVVVVGGGAVRAGNALLDPARERCAVAIEGAGYRPPVPIVEAALGNDAGAIGAATLALEELGG
ncbi:MAG TPA: ROK family glucokinase [Actinomycetota bacterium]|jgi:glucokinase